MSIASIIARLDSAVPSLVAVEEPSRVNPLERDAYPVATVYLGADQRKEGAFGQGSLVTRQYLVLITSNSANGIESAIGAVVGALRGWRPDGAATPLDYREGRTEVLDGTLIQYAAVFDCTVCI